MHPYFSLQGRTALVTGGTRGIGKMIAKAFVEAGANVYVCARDGEACAQTAEELSAFGSCHGIAANLAHEEGVQALASQLAAEIGQLDILVNNAGTTWGAPLESYPVKGWEKVMQLNVTSVFSCIQQLLPLLRKAGSAANPARVINIGSVAGITSHGEDAYAYGPSKAALHQHVAHVGARTGRAAHQRQRDRPWALPQQDDSAHRRRCSSHGRRQHADPDEALGPRRRNGRPGDQPGKYRRRLHDREYHPDRWRFQPLRTASRLRLKTACKP